MTKFNSLFFVVLEQSNFHCCSGFDRFRFVRNVNREKEQDGYNSDPSECRLLLWFLTVVVHHARCG
jgi:hypothetical protein